VKSLVLLAVLALAACAGGDEAAGGIPDDAPELQSFDGTIAYVELEGGFYGIVTAQGHELLPTNLPEEYREDGLAVRVTGGFPQGVASVQMWGRPFYIVEIVRR